MDVEPIAREIVDTAIRVHTRLGPGMLEGAYEACVEYELGRRSLRVRKQVPMPLHYDDLTLDIGYRLDLLVEDAVVVERKSVHTTGVPVCHLWRGSFAPFRSDC